MVIGTNHFRSLEDAIRYYQEYGISEEDVKQKLLDCEIHICQPSINPGDTLVLIDNGTRWAIQS